jgi:hypothetical protein
VSDERYPAASGIPHDIAVERGVCGARRKNEDAPCEGPRDAEGRSICGRHCGSKNRRGYPCSQHPRANGRCNNHGAKSLAGVASPRWKHGRDSGLTSVLTGTDLERFEDAMSDPAWIEMREEMALLHTLLLDALERAQVGQLGPLWDELAGQWRRFRVAQRSGESGAAAGALTRVGEIIDRGAESWRAHEEVGHLIERKRKMAETERRRITEAEHMISAARALAFAGAVVASVRRRVGERLGGTEDEREILANVSADLAALVHQDIGGRSAG